MVIQWRGFTKNRVVEIIGDCLQYAEKLDEVIQRHSYPICAKQTVPHEGIPRDPQLLANFLIQRLYQAFLSSGQSPFIMELTSILLCGSNFSEQPCERRPILVCPLGQAFESHRQLPTHRLIDEPPNLLMLDRLRRQVLMLVN